MIEYIAIGSAVAITAVLIRKIWGSPIFMEFRHWLAYTLMLIGAWSVIVYAYQHIALNLVCYGYANRMPYIVIMDRDQVCGYNNDSL